MLLDIFKPAATQVVKDTDLCAPGDQSIGEVGPDKRGPAGYQHATSIPIHVFFIGKTWCTSPACNPSGLTLRIWKQMRVPYIV